MEQKPSLSQYFGEGSQPAVSHIFDEIGIQSVYLGDSDTKETTTSNIFEQNMAVSYTNPSVSADIGIPNIIPTVSGTTQFSNTTLPDPSTFFDNIGPEPVISVTKDHDQVIRAMEGLSVTNQPVDKELDRRRDAWLPNEDAQKSLMKAQSSPKGSFFPEKEVLTMPGLILEEELINNLQESATRHLGVGAWGSRGALRADHVTKDEAGLRELLRLGYLRATINMTGSLLEAAGQGAGRINRQTKHTPRTLQLWLTRFAIMVRIKQMEVLEEAKPFGDFSKPDMFYQFYPDTYGDRSGSLVPFSLRLLIAELPMMDGKPEEALERLYAMLTVIKQMRKNLISGKTEDGTSDITSEQDKTESLRLWTVREMRVMHSIINCAIALKDYRLAIKLLATLTDYPDVSVSVKRAITSALCRLCVESGHLKAAWRYLEIARDFRQHICPTPDVMEYIDLGLINLAQGKYQDAYNNFVKASDQEPTNIIVANNLAVCLLYMGTLKDSIKVLEKVLHSDPERALNENLLLNLCTLYELESSNPKEKKLNLLRMLCKYKSDTLPNVTEALKLNV